jgi:hypothetical protein
MSEPEGKGMTERMAAMKAALISINQDLKAAEARVEVLRKEHAELVKSIEEATTPKA